MRRLRTIWYAIETAYVPRRTYQRKFIQPEIDRMKAAHTHPLIINFILDVAFRYADPNKMPHELLHELVDTALNTKEAD